MTMKGSEEHAESFEEGGRASSYFVQSSYVDEEENCYADDIIELCIIVPNASSKFFSAYQKKKILKTMENLYMCVRFDILQLRIQHIS